MKTQEEGETEAQEDHEKLDERAREEAMASETPEAQIVAAESARALERVRESAGV